MVREFVLFYPHITLCWIEFLSGHLPTMLLDPQEHQNSFYYGQIAFYRKVMESGLQPHSPITDSKSGLQMILTTL